MLSPSYVGWDTRKAHQNCAEQFVRGQSDPELNKYLWVVIRTQKDRKLQTLIKVCTDFSSLTAPAHLHRLAEQTFAVHQQMETPYAEEDCESEAVFAVGDCLPWANRRPPDTSGVPSLQQMFALARRMGYEMRHIARQADTCDNNKETDRSLIRTGGSVLRHGPVETIPRSSASAEANSDICDPVARDRTLRYHSNQRVGFSNRTVVNREMAIINRETPLRPGPHPHRSAHTSFDPHLISTH